MPALAITVNAGLEPGVIWNWTTDGGSTVNTASDASSWQYVDELIAAANDQDAVSIDANQTKTLPWRFTTPADLVSIRTLTVSARLFSTASDDAGYHYFQVVAADGTTAYTDEVSHAQSGSYAVKTVTMTFALTAAGLAATKADWDAARINVRFRHVANMGADAGKFWMTAIELGGTYKVPVVYSRPSADVTAASGWTITGGATRSEVLDDNSDADYIRHATLAAEGSGSTFAVQDASAVTDPAMSTDHVLRARVMKESGEEELDFNLVLKQGYGTPGVVSIASLNRQNIGSVGAYVTYEYTLTAAQADAITDYNDLTFDFSCTRLNDLLKTEPIIQVAWMELELPQATATGLALTQSMADALTLADSTATASNVAAAVADALALADATAQTSAWQATATDSAALGDSVAPASAAEHAHADTLPLADATATARGQEQALSDTLTLADAVARQIAPTVADTLTVADSTAVDLHRALEQALADAVTLADSAQLAADATLLDALALADSTATASNVAAALADSAALADNVTPEALILIEQAVADTLTVGDSTRLEAAAAIASAVTLADAASLDTARAVADTAGLGDVLELALTAGIADPLTTADELAFGQVGGALEQAVSDALTLADALTRLIGPAAADTLAVSDATATESTIARAIADAAALADAATTAAGVQHTAGDTLTLADALSTSATGLALEHTLTDSAAVADALEHAISQRIADAAALADQHERASTLDRVYADTVAVLDALETALPDLGLGAIRPTVIGAIRRTPAGSIAAGGAGSIARKRAGTVGPSDPGSIL